MINTLNLVMVTGKMVSDVKIYDNADGSKRVYFKVAVDDNFTNAKGIKSVQFIPFETFIASGRGLGVYELIHQGDLVQVTASVRNNNYKDAQGAAVYGISFMVEGVSVLESKAIREGRKARRATSKTE